MMSRKSSSGNEYSDFKNEGIWQHFLREKNGQSAQCKICTVIIKTVGGSTSGMHTHLQTKHKISIRKRQASDETTASTSVSACSTSSSSSSNSKVNKVSPMDKYIKDADENSIGAVLARMTSCDGLPFLVFTTSDDLRRALGALGFSVPRSPDTIKKLVMDHSKTVQQTVVNELALRKKRGERFSLTFDEWTSIKNRRFMCINVHERGVQFWSLGLIRVKGSMPAMRCIELLDEKLKMFGLDLKQDIVSITTDGASVMTKVGRCIQAEQQLCYAHAVQLAVLDVLYKKPQVAQTKQTDLVGVVDDQESDDDNDSEMNCVDLKPESDGELETEITDAFEVTDSGELALEVSEEYYNVINRVRHVVKIFRRSPTKNDDVLQPYVKREVGHELQLSLDCRTRWSSLFDMLKRFVQLRIPIQKAMIDIGEPDCVSDADFTTIKEIVGTLEPVKLAVEALCRRDTTLLSADAALKFCIVNLEKQRSELAKVMASSLRNRVKERRSLAGYLLFLHNPGVSSVPGDEVFTVPSSSAVSKFVHCLLSRMDSTFSGRWLCCNWTFYTLRYAYEQVLNV